MVDDHSTDKTADEARQAGAGVLEAPPLSKEAQGKSNACMAGRAYSDFALDPVRGCGYALQQGFLESVIEGAYHSEYTFLCDLTHAAA